MVQAVLFYGLVEFRLNQLITLALVVIELYALVNCLTQRADAFPVVGSLSKNAWLGILLASLLVTGGCGFYVGLRGALLFILIAVTASAIYLLDVRPALRDATNGSGGW